MLRGGLRTDIIVTIPRPGGPLCFFEIFNKAHSCTLVILKI